MRNYILRGDSTNPWRNLAVEALIFEALGASARVFYLWQNQNTVVIGRHQNSWKECRVQLLEAEGGRLARRSTGGGAVFHDLGNLNFSFVMPRSECDTARQLKVIQRALAEFGIEARFTGRNDLVVHPDGAKFSGSAFKYTEAAGLHHGTLMVAVEMDKLSRYLAPGQDKLRAKGIESVRSRVCNLRDYCADLTIDALSEALARAFTDEYGAAEALTCADLDAARLAVLEAQYASWDFRLGKALPFDATLQRRFPWGGVTLEMRLKQGIIAEARAWSDAMDEAMVERIAPALVGVRYENADLARALRGLNHPQADELAGWIETEDLG